jgi:ABC-type molybdate transport system ATPase subunit
VPTQRLRLRLRVRARDVSLATERPRALSIRNVLAGTLLQLRERGLRAPQEMTSSFPPPRGG